MNQWLKLGLTLIGIVIGTWPVVAAAAQPPVDNESSRTQTVDGSDDFNQLITQLVRDSIPHTFTEDKDWGGQEERFDGFKRTRKGLRVKFEKREKRVNHGTWKKYQVSLRDPDQAFSIAINNLRELNDGSIEFDVDVGSDLDIHGRQAKWIKGVQLYSISVDGDATVRLRLNVKLEVHTDATSFPPDLVFQPSIQSAHVQLDALRIDRVSKAGGEFAQQATRHVRRLLEKKIADKEKDLPDKLNKKIAQEEDHLRISTSDLLDTKWTAAAGELVPKIIEHTSRSPPTKLALPQLSPAQQD